MTYRALFTGRERGALGILYTIEAEIAAESEAAVREELYSRYEHVSALTITPVPYDCL